MSYSSALVSNQSLSMGHCLHNQLSIRLKSEFLDVITLVRRTMEKDFSSGMTNFGAHVQVLGTYCGENTLTTSDETNAESLPEDAEEATIIPSI